MKTKPIILAIVGESGSGKTHIANWLGDHGYCHTIVSSTTRPMRENETDGRDHVFVSEESMPDKAQMLAYTFFGGYHYWTSFNDLDEHKYNAYVIDEQGLCDLYELESQNKISVIWCQVERPDNPIDDKRKSRDLGRKPALKKLAQMGKTPDIKIVNDSTLEALEKKIKCLIFTQLVVRDVEQAVSNIPGLRIESIVTSQN